MYTVGTDQTGVDERRQAIARSLGFLTAVEVALLAGVKSSTLESWRRRRTGPPYVQFGNEALYALSDVQTFLQAEKKYTRALDVKSLL